MTHRILVLLLCGAFAACRPEAPPPPGAPPAEAAAPTGPAALDLTLRAAGASGKKVIVAVYAPWCPWCKKMDAETYADADVQRLLAEHFEVYRLNADDDSTAVQYRGQMTTGPQLAAAMGARGFPATVFLDSDGALITTAPGFIAPDEFGTILAYFGTNAHERQSFQEFAAARSAAP